jgi:SAM-dependent methyltransferase
MGWAIGVVLGGLTLLWIAWNFTLDALWQPTDQVTVQRILFLAGLREGEHVVDLGCGDGRIVVAAAKSYPVRATGVEIDPFRVLFGRLWILFAGVRRRARILRRDMYAFDLADVDVVILFLSATANFKLQTKLKRELRRGARVVSYYHPMWGWTPSTTGEARDGYPIYVYEM